MFEKKYKEDSYVSLTLSIGKSTVDILLDYLHELSEIKQSSFVEHEHTAHEVYFIEQGNMQLVCNGDTVSLEKGDMFIIPAHMFHRICSYSTDFRRFNLRFAIREPIVQDILCYHHSGEHGNDMLPVIQYIRRTMNSFDPFDFYRLRTQLGFLFSYVLEMMLPEKNGLMVTRAHTQYSHLQQYVRIDQFFFHHCSEQITLAALAGQLNYSLSQTNRILHEYSGMSFGEKLRETRLRLAKQMLAEKNEIDDIARKCGYSTRQGFDRMFRKYCGLSPAAYRKELMKEKSL